MSEQQPTDYAELPDSWNLSGALALAALSGVVVIVRVLNVSSWNPDVATQLVASLDAPRVLLGTSIALTPYIAPLIAIASWAVYRGHEKGTPHRDLWLTAFLGSASISVFITPIWVLVLIGLIGGVIRVVKRRQMTRPAAGGPPSRPQPVGMRYYMLLVVGLPLAQQLVFSPAPWLPPENIAVPSGVISGYVIGEDAHWTSILTYSPRIVINIPSDRIPSRAYCVRTAGWLSLSLIGAIDSTRPPILPSCVS